MSISRITHENLKRIMIAPLTSSVKEAIYQNLRSHRILPNQIRLLPDYMIIGAQRCGTTSLYHYLKQHPCVGPALLKEVHFFDINFSKGIAWYRAHFPSFLYKFLIKQISKQNFVTGEASPCYLFHPHAPKRVRKILPRVKLIILLRNPVDRAYSHYHHESRKGREALSFEDAIEGEEERLRGELDKMLADDNYFSFNRQHYAYLSRGVYIDQLKTWMSLFPKDQFLIIKSEDFYEDPPRIYKQVLKFLNLPDWELKEYSKYNYAHYSKIDVTTRKRLIDYFKPHNQRLYEYLGVNFDWESW